MKLFLTSFCVLLTFAAFEADSMLGPVGNIIANSLYVCDEKPTGDIFTIETEIRTIDDKGNKAMYANFTTKILIDETTECSVDIQKWDGGGWKKYYSIKEKFCVGARKLFPKIWDKMRATVKPAILQTCPVKPGKYVLDKFQLSSKDVTLPAILYGRFLVIFKAIVNKKMIMCLQGEGVSQAP